MTTRDRSAQPDRGQAPRRQRRHDPPARHPDGRPRDADRRLPAPRRRRPGLPARIGRRRRAPRAVLVPRRRAAPAPRGARRPGAARRLDPARVESTTCRCRSSGPPAADPLDALRRFMPRRRVVPTAGMPRFTGGAVGALAYDAVAAFRADGSRAPDARPGRRARRGLHRDGPRPRLRPPDAHPVGHRLAAHGRAGLRGPLRDRRAGDLRGARADRAADAPRCGTPARATDGSAARRAPRAGPAIAEDRIRTSLGRDAYDDAVVSPRMRSRPARRSRSCWRAASRSSPGRCDGPAARRHRPVSRAAPRQPQPVPVLRPDAGLRGRRAPARSCSSRSRATA